MAFIYSNLTNPPNLISVAFTAGSADFNRKRGEIFIKPIADCLHIGFFRCPRFKKELNMTLSDYVLSKKIEEAKHLLLFTDYSFQEISTLLNFTSQSHFTQRFKQIAKQTPKEFRQTNFQYL